MIVFYVDFFISEINNPARMPITKQAIILFVNVSVIPLLPICLSLPVPSTMLHWISTTYLFANHTRDQMTSLLVMVDVCTTLMLARPLFPLHLTLSLSNVLCVPTMKQNIISVSQLCKTNNASIEFNPSFCAKDLTTRALLTQGWSKNNVYKWSTRDASTKRSSKLA